MRLQPQMAMIFDRVQNITQIQSLPEKGIADKSQEGACRSWHALDRHTVGDACTWPQELYGQDWKVSSKKDLEACNSSCLLVESKKPAYAVEGWVGAVGVPCAPVALMQLPAEETLCYSSPGGHTRLALHMVPNSHQNQDQSAVHTCCRSNKPNHSTIRKA